ncbi:hypothetical protein [Granulicoccus sp. GXG6511]|uniref:hypothetical protein n=1 Tax=Granulicoccus sp. GXG6511 TaxID=3381351 RepID=UPI003D7D193D
MTGSADEVAVRPSQSGPSIAVVRARRLLAGGLAGAHVAALTCVGIFLVRDGLPGLASAGLAAAMVVLFYTVGQWVQIQVADAPARTVFRASVASYIARVAALGGLLFLYLGNASGESRLLAAPLVITAVATVVGWIAGEVIVFSKLRIPNFDEPVERGVEK